MMIEALIARLRKKTSRTETRFNEDGAIWLCSRCALK